MSYYRTQLEEYLKQLHITADVVVDIGGGAWPVKERVAEWTVRRYLIYDNGIEAAKSDTSVIEYDLNEINYSENSNIERSKEADMLFCLEVFEYIWNPVKAIQNIYALLKDGGKAYITFPFVYPKHQPIEEDCLRYTDSGIIKLLSKAGFNTDADHLKITPRWDKSGKLVEFYKADGMHPAKGEYHNISGWIVEVTK